MQKILVINAGMKFAHSGGKLNETITSWDRSFFTAKNGFELRITETGEGDYDIEEEIEKFLWADTIIYHFPIWWMYIPFTLKEYLKSLFKNDGVIL
ncbi:NAD(P)H-dependent oxidoreductase [Sphingobacterium siyangense]|uniref:NAD(P)H-dependent oxidoreductase n=1 Tax=Sphingobacterium siyangense TaxID=459529 RepID=UPI002FDD5E6F